MHSGRSHRWGFHTIHRRNGCQKKSPAAASLWTPQNVLRWRSSHDVPWFWRPWGWDRECYSLVYVMIDPAAARSKNQTVNLLFLHLDQNSDSLAVVVFGISLIFSFTSLSATRPSLLSKNPRLHHTLVPVCQGQASWPPGMTRTSQNIHVDEGCWNPALKGHNPRGSPVSSGRKQLQIALEEAVFLPGWTENLAGLKPLRTGLPHPDWKPFSSNHRRQKITPRTRLGKDAD